MNSLTQQQQQTLVKALAERKERLLEEIRRVLARSGRESYADLLGGTGDTGDEAMADLLRDVTQAEVARDINEVRDILAAEQRIASGRYALCVDCGADISFERLQAYPTAKRCLPCQQRREKTRAFAPHSRL